MMRKGTGFPRKTNSGTAHFTYDKSGQLTKEVRSNGDILEYTYDTTNQLSTINGKAMTHDESGNMTNDGV
ncbi:hypothetical protein [Heyndrickxia sp. FSL W8-0423]